MTKYDVFGVRLLALWLLCQIAAAAVALRMAWAIITNPPRAWTIALAYDRLGNAAANDDTVQTVSSRAEKARRAGKRWGCRLCRLLDQLDPGHCERSLESDEGERI